MGGTHRPDGILIATGPGVAKRDTPTSPLKKVNAHIVDCAPTILALMGLKIPENKEERVITDLFATPPTVEKTVADVDATGPTTPGGSGSDSEAVYNDQDLEQITARLSDLGYLE